MTSFSFSKDQLTSILPKRTQSSNKGTYGRLLVIGGSDGMCGAPYFTAKAAYRSGVGLVEIFSSAENRIPLQTLIPEAVLTLYDARSVDLYSLEHSLERSDAVAIGMGLSQNASSLEILKFTLENCKRPLLIDADALNLISKNVSLFDPLKAIGDRAIITPHLMEMSRLISREVDEIAKDVPAFASY